MRVCIRLPAGVQVSRDFGHAFSGFFRKRIGGRCCDLCLRLTFCSQVQGGHGEQIYGVFHVELRLECIELIVDGRCGAPEVFDLGGGRSQWVFPSGYVESYGFHQDSKIAMHSSISLKSA